MPQLAPGVEENHGRGQHRQLANPPVTRHAERGQPAEQDYLNTELNKENPVLIMGDVNISPTDLDIGIGEDSRKRWLRTGKCSFLPEEREWMDRLMSWGLVDTFRTANPETQDRFSWFDYRSKGFDDNRGLRIDLLLASQPLAERCIETGIDYDIRSMEKPSDHAPVWAKFKL